MEAINAKLVTTIKDMQMKECNSAEDDNDEIVDQNMELYSRNQALEEDLRRQAMELTSCREACEQLREDMTSYLSTGRH